MTLQGPQIAPFSIFSHFPVEVVRLIFELSALSSDRTAANLARVSKPVYSWVIPILYETIVISRPQAFLRILITITSTNSTKRAQLALLVRNICISLPDRFDEYLNRVSRFPWDVPWDVDELLRTCTNLHSLYINDTHTHIPLRRHTNCHHHLRHLHCGSWDTWLNHDFLSFDTLTHLRVDLAYNSAIGPTWTPLLPPSTRLPNLTHLAFGTDRRNAPSELRGAASFVQRMLARRGIVMLVVTVWFCWEEAESCGLGEVFNEVADKRLCLLMKKDSPLREGSVKEWEDEVQGRESIWDKAAAVMKRHGGGGLQVGGDGVAIDILETAPSSDYR